MKYEFQLKVLVRQQGILNSIIEIHQLYSVLKILQVSSFLPQVKLKMFSYDNPALRRHQK